MDSSDDRGFWSARRTPTATFPMCPAMSPIRRIRRSSTRSSRAAKQIGADLIMASDPDCDRLGCAAPRSRLERTVGDIHRQSDRRAADRFSPRIAKAAGTPLAASIMSSRRSSPRKWSAALPIRYRVRTLGNLQVGFKWIAKTMDEAGPEMFVFRLRRIAWLFGGRSRPRQRCRRGRDALGRVGGESRKQRANRCTRSSMRSIGSSAIMPSGRFRSRCPARRG